MQIRPKVFSGHALRKMAHLLGVSVPEALGILAFIWNEAELKDVIYAEPEELVDWSQWSGQNLIPVLEKTKFIEMDFGEGKYRIKGRKVKNSPKGWMVWGCYSNLYEQKYGLKPKASPQEMKMAAKHYETYGEEIFAIIEFFLSNHKKYYVEKCHAFTVLTVGEVSALRAQLKNGTMITSKDAQRVENRDANVRAIREVLKNGR